MTKDKKNECECCESCCDFSIANGLKFGFGMFVAFLAGTAILVAVAAAFYYLSKLI